LKPEHQSPAAAGRFRTTRWSAVLLSAQSQAPGPQAALAELCRIYWYPIYAFVQRCGSRFDTESAEYRYRLDELDSLTAGP